ncbi:MAG: hypothetical protein QME83_05435 [Thermodesulfobacteriota bacterium]|nr:hypothetical protein [Thermodesulfobacteriota bacterium]
MKMDKGLNCQNHWNWAISDKLLVDLSSMKDGFLEMNRYRQEIWDYIKYREGLVKWPSMNEQIKGGAL